MRLIDPTKTKIFKERTRLGWNITRREHFNGSVDANVQLKAIKIEAHVRLRQLETIRQDAAACGE